MITAFRIFLLTGFLVLTLAGCANIFNVTEPVAKVAPPPPAPPPPQIVPVHREPGAIWTENSRWNEFYSGKTGRNPGDLILIKPTDGFKASVAARTARGGESAFSASKDNSYMVVAIKDVVGHNVYAISAHQSIKSSKGDNELNLQGKVREQDIAADDSVSSDLIFDMVLDVKTPPESDPKLASADSSRKQSYVIDRPQDFAPEPTEKKDTDKKEAEKKEGAAK